MHVHVPQALYPDVMMPEMLPLHLFPGQHHLLLHQLLQLHQRHVDPWEDMAEKQFIVFSNQVKSEFVTMCTEKQKKQNKKKKQCVLMTEKGRITNKSLQPKDRLTDCVSESIRLHYSYFAFCKIVVKCFLQLCCLITCTQFFVYSRDI